MCCGIASGGLIMNPEWLTTTVLKAPNIVVCNQNGTKGNETVGAVTFFNQLVDANGDKVNAKYFDINFECFSNANMVIVSTFTILLSLLNVF